MYDRDLSIPFFLTLLAHLRSRILHKTTPPPPTTTTTTTTTTSTTSKHSRSRRYALHVIRYTVQTLNARERQDLESAIPHFQYVWSTFDPCGTGVLPPKFLYAVSSSLLYRKKNGRLNLNLCLIVVVVIKSSFSVFSSLLLG